MFGRKKAALADEQIARARKIFDEMPLTPELNPGSYIRAFLRRPDSIQLLKDSLASQEDAFQSFAPRFVRTYELYPVQYP